MEIRYNVTGNERKRLAEYIAGFLGCEKEYLGAPGFAYRVGYIEVGRDGTVTFDDRAYSEEVATLLKELEDEGFHAAAKEPAAKDNGGGGDADRAARDACEGSGAQDGGIGLTVRVPLGKANAGNLTRLLEAKGALIKKALGIGALPVEIEEDAIAFPWFAELPGPDEAKAYTHLIAAMCEMSRRQKHVTATEKDVENEKYAFRTWLLRLGFIGPEYKAERKILLKNLSGSSAFRDGGRRDEVSE